MTLVDVVNDELDRLPGLGQALLAELDSYAGQLNVGVPTTDPSYRTIARLAVRLTDTARRQLDQSVYTLEYDHDTPVERQDLIALALARWLSGQ